MSSSEGGFPAVDPFLDRGEAQIESARRLLTGLVQAGVDHLVISPGSRSTPLVLAAQELREPKTVWIDERAAAFYALGLARAGGCPALICTSGTAPAHYLPALLEARADAETIVVLTADRPQDRLDCGAPQTVDQHDLFGKGVVVARDLGEIGAGERSARAAVRRGVDALVLGRQQRGPVHLNVRFRKPLQPSAATDRGRSSEIAADSYRHSAPPFESAAAVAAELLRWIGEARRPLVILGPGPLSQAELRGSVGRLSRRFDLPLVVDWASQQRPSGAGASDDDGPLFWHGFGELLAAPLASEVRQSLRADLVIQIGRVPTATAWEAWLEEVVAAGGRHVVVGEQRSDPVSTSHWWIEARPEALLSELLDGSAGDASTAAAPRDWAPIVRSLLAVVDRATADAAGTWGEAAVVRGSVDSLSRPTLLAVGNSLAIRVLDSFGPPGSAVPIDVLAQRGVNGIDGSFASLAGALQASGGWQAAMALIGDVTARHDLTSLELLQLVASSRQLPVVVVVLDNNGGRIFEQLPLARQLGRSRGELEPWTTPRRPGSSLEGVVRGLGCDFAGVGAQGELEQALRAALGQSGVTVIEAVVPPRGAVGAWDLVRDQIVAAAREAEDRQ